MMDEQRDSKIKNFHVDDSTSILRFIQNNPRIEELKQAYAVVYNYGNRTGARLLWTAIMYATDETSGGAYEVYIAEDKDGGILYIGSGKRGRHRHCTSGSSHVVELNRMCLSGDEINVSIVFVCKTKQESINIESNLIKTLKPALNKKR